ncbi:hypothetical protein [Brevibacillus sp. Leaf182]|uniref:hypothetical protein n=1 Tax=Brevibacillus sp. Leaf182 TaxID=1736290 RepID=UPI0006FB84D1|nr:hypothetical protein [Brevibacillus sp. Leaf182]RAT97701.1 hypothetical protein ASG16_011440 [Brevibacillus sp. Leaf182]
MEMKTDFISFGSYSGDGPRTASKHIVFGSNVLKATAILTGTDFGFSPKKDQHLGMVNIKVDATTPDNSNIVTVTATLGVRDWSGSWDDKYEGNIYFAVIAELV